MKLLLSFILAGFLTLNVAPPAVVFVMQDTRYTGETEKVERTRVTVQGTNLKFERLAEDGTVLGTDLIFRGDLDQMWLIDDDTKTIRVMDREAIDAVADQLDAAMAEMNKELEGLPANQRAAVEKMLKERMRQMQGGGDDAVQPEIVGPNDAYVVAGYPCRKYDVLEGGEKTKEVWVTNWIRLREGKVAKDALLAMGKFYEGMMAALRKHMPMGMGSGLAQNPFSAIDIFNGYPVLTTHFKSGQRTYESKLVAVETVAGAHFEKPEGYTVKSMVE